MTGPALSVFTVGHSTHTPEEFIALLVGNGVTAVADVRSVPFSRLSHFKQDALASALARKGIVYTFLGRELGARSDDPSCYEDNRVQYARLAVTELFRSGIARLMRGAAQHCVAVMCAEKEPLDCHRTLLVAQALTEQGVSVEHILADGRREAHAETLERLLERSGLAQDELLRTRDDRLADALLRREQEIAFVSHGAAAEGVGDSR